MITITVSSLPEAKKPEATDDLKMLYNKLRAYHHTLNSVHDCLQNKDREGMALALKIAENPDDVESIVKLQRHFAEMEKARILKRQKQIERSYKLRHNVIHSMNEIGYKVVYNYTGLVPLGGCRFTPECGRGRDLVFSSWEEAADWLKSASAWRPL